MLALLGLLVALHRSDAGRRKAPRRDWRPRLSDLAVTAVLGVWWVIGAVTVDDGYIAGIIRSRGENGFIGNVYRWLNAPESPFSWFYDVLYPWSQVSASTLWMRLPATLLGLVTWVLLSRYALPRLGVHTPWLAALAFTTWWVPLCLGLRPEPWVAAGLLGCWVLVERAIATRRLLPLVGGLLLAGATTALTPGGLIAFVPFLTPPVWRVLRARTDLHRWPLVAALVAAPASAVLLMVYDQSLAAVLESTRVRSLIGGGAPWYGEAERYYYLLAEGFQGSIGRRAAVLVTLLAAAAVLLAVRKGPKHRMVVDAAARAGGHDVHADQVDPALRRPGGRGRGGARARRGHGAAHGRRAGRGGGRRRLRGGGHEPVAVRVGLVHPDLLDAAAPGRRDPAGDAAAGGGRGGRRGRAGVATGDAAGAAGRGRARRSRLALQVLGLARVAVAHRDSYTPASDALATLRGDPCGLQRTLSVETDPAAGLLGTGGVPVDIGGTTLPGFVVDQQVATGVVPVARRPGRRHARSARCAPATTCGSTSARDPARSPRQATPG